MTGEKGVTLLTTYLINNSSIPQTQSSEVTYVSTETSSWTASIGYELGVSTTVEAGIPEVASGSVNIKPSIYFPFLLKSL